MFSMFMMKLTKGYASRSRVKQRLSLTQTWQLDAVNFYFLLGHIALGLHVSLRSVVSFIIVCGLCFYCVRSSSSSAHIFIEVTIYHTRRHCFGRDAHFDQSDAYMIYHV